MINSYLWISLVILVQNIQVKKWRRRKKRRPCKWDYTKEDTTKSQS